MVPMPAPIVCPRRVVEREWIDYNGHMNVAFYSLVFDQALDHVLDGLGIGTAYVRERQCSLFTVETHLHFIGEVAEGDPLRVEYRLLDWDDKRLHSFGEMYHATQNYLAATSEQLSLHISMAARKVVAFPDDVERRIGAAIRDHLTLPWPARAGQVGGIPAAKSRSMASRLPDDG